MSRSTLSETDEQGRYNADRCRATRRLRTRLRALTDRVDALEAELREARQVIAKERADLTAYLEGPEAKLAQLQEAQRLMQSAMAEAVMRHAQCSECGGLGKDMAPNLLKDVIAAHCREHDLQPEAQPDIPWPHVGAGRMRDRSWLVKPKPRRDVGVW